MWSTTTNHDDEARVCWSGARSGGRGRLKSQKAQKEIDEYLTINCELSIHKSMGSPHVGRGNDDKRPRKKHARSFTLNEAILRK